MTELGYVEKPMLDWPKGMGWTCRTDEQMEVYGGAGTIATEELP